MHKEKNSLLISFLVMLGGAAIAIVCSWLVRDFDAQGYVNAVLNQHYQGTVNEMAKFVNLSTEELHEQYEDGVVSFVQNNITSGVEMDETLEQKYIALGKEIFMIMQYNVTEAEKISSKEYNVPVEYQTMNIFANFIELVHVESQKIYDKVEKGEYTGTVDEINKQMQEEFLNNAYDCLMQAYQEVAYEEKETMIFKVKENEEGLFVVDEEQIYDFTTKIMGFDEIQD